MFQNLHQYLGDMWIRYHKKIFVVSVIIRSIVKFVHYLDNMGICHHRDFLCSIIGSILESVPIDGFCYFLPLLGNT